MSDKKINSYCIQEIQRRIPHRYPFLMVDYIEESGPGYAFGLKNVSINEPYFQGHFPHSPIMPGVLITESILQTSAFMGAPEQADSTKILDNTGKHFFCTGFKMKFHLPVIPGNQLRIEVRLVRTMSDMTQVKAMVKTEDGVVSSGILNLSVIKKEKK